MIAIPLGWIALIGPGAIEGKIFPASAPAYDVVSREDPTNDQWVLVSGASKRLRPECSPRKLEWFAGERHNQDTVVDWDWGRPIVRSKGEFLFYDWRVRAAPPEYMMERTFADVLHQCFVVVPMPFRNSNWIKSAFPKIAPERNRVRIPLPWLTRSAFWN